jgi:hypothetical protein
LTGVSKISLIATLLFSVDFIFCKVNEIFHFTFISYIYVVNLCSA